MKIIFYSPLGCYGSGCINADQWYWQGVGGDKSTLLKAYQMTIYTSFLTVAGSRSPCIMYSGQLWNDKTCTSKGTVACQFSFSLSPTGKLRRWTIDRFRFHSKTLRMVLPYLLFCQYLCPVFLQLQSHGGKRVCIQAGLMDF